MVLRKAGRPGFSLVELVVVIVIIGILAAIAIPRLSRGAAGASRSAVAANLATMRNAIAMYAAEHKNAFPGPDDAGFVDQLTLYSDINGATQATRDATHIYGPYVLSIPPCPVGPAVGTATADDVKVGASVVPDETTGWIYNKDTGEFRVNSDDTDETGVAYNTY